ncbi:MAG: OmpA family protein [Thermoanaerobaculia bacterium]|nr:OmpA family protein [Thermoanaerobaculia bacterium]
MNFRNFFALMLLLTLAVSTTFAATFAKITLSDGSELEGEILGLDKGIYTIRQANGRERSLRESDVVKIEIQKDLSGTEAPPASGLRFAGSNTVGEKLLPELAAAFVERRGARRAEWEPGMKENERRLVVGDPAGKRVPTAIAIAAHGSSTAFVALKDGSADVGMASRRIKDDEITSLAGLGAMKHSRSEHVIALDGLAIIVHPDNRVPALTVEQIARIFSCAITDWSAVGGKPGPINLYARDQKSGTFDTFKSLVLDSNKTILCLEANRFESSTELSDAVAGDPNGIGFIGLPYVLKARALAIKECDLSYKPTAFEIRSEEYPLFRRLYLYTPEQPKSPFVGEFVDFALSPSGYGVVDKVGFVNLDVKQDVSQSQFLRTPAAVLSAQNLQALQQFVQMTRYATRLSVTFRFEPGEADLDTLAVRDLDRLVSYLKSDEARGRELVLLGFADSVGDYRQNRDLSQQRADTVANELRSRGASVAVVVGLGEEAPVACNETDPGRTRNRRVEVWLK